MVVGVELGRREHDTRRHSHQGGGGAEVFEIDALSAAGGADDADGADDAAEQLSPQDLREHFLVAQQIGVHDAPR
jgi:hypothetical protein